MRRVCRPKKPVAPVIAILIILFPLHLRAMCSIRRLPPRDECLFTGVSSSHRGSDPTGYISIEGVVFDSLCDLPELRFCFEACEIRLLRPIKNHAAATIFKVERHLA